MFNRSFNLVKNTYLTLHQKEAMKLPKVCRRISIVSGIAWISIGQQDIIARTGETVALPFSKEAAVISPLSNSPVTWVMGNG